MSSALPQDTQSAVAPPSTSTHSGLTPRTGSLELLPLEETRTSSASRTDFTSTTATLNDAGQTTSAHISARTSVDLPTSTNANVGAHSTPSHKEAESLLEDQPQTHASIAKPSTITSLFLDTWICEVIAVAFSSACIAAIAIVLFEYDDKPIPRFPSGVTLNTIVSILSTAARSAIVLAVSTAIGQLKWCWYRRSGRSLQDVQTMDDASRGLVGAAKMLATRKGGYLAALGGVISLTMIAFSPFFQQLLEYPTRPLRLPEDGAQVAQGVNYTMVSDLPSLTNAASAGLFADESTFDRVPTCPATRCEWDTYKSIEWCTKCEDFTATAKLGDCDYMKVLKDAPLRPADPPVYFCNVTLGKGHSYPLMWMRNESTSYPFNPATVYLATEAAWTISDLDEILVDKRFKEFDEHLMDKRRETYIGVDGPLLVVGHIILNNYTDDGLTLLRSFSIAEASQCLVTLCEKEYKVEMDNGKPSTSVINTSYGHTLEYGDLRTQDPNSMRPADLQSLELSDPRSQIGWQPDSAPTNLSDPEQRPRNDSKLAFAAGKWSPAWIAGFFTGNASTPWHHGSPDASGAFYWVSGGNYTSQPRILGNMNDRKFSSRLASYAAALTSHGMSRANNTLSGYAFSNEVYVRVRWKWIALPVGLQVLTIVLLGATIFHSRRVGAPVWKSSLLAAWYHKTEEGEALGGDESSCERLSEMSRLASATAVRLEKTDGDGGHVFRRVVSGEAMAVGHYDGSRL